MKFYYETTFPTLHVQSDELAMLPIRKDFVIDYPNLQVLALVDSIILAKQANPTADTSEQERAIDLMVYKLYGLTYDEVKVVDPETTITEEEYEKGN